MRTDTRRVRARRGFSLVEMLIALTITSTLLTAALSALDASFKSYQYTTDGASTHVVSRIVMHRLMSMIRTGTDFAPYPVDPLDSTQNPIVSDSLEFKGYVPEGSGITRVIRIEKRTGATAGTHELWYTQEDYNGATLVSTDSRPLLSNLQDIQFTLEYDVGPRLKRATVDLTVKPDDIKAVGIHSDIESPLIRFVSSVNPRRLDD